MHQLQQEAGEDDSENDSDFEAGSGSSSSSEASGSDMASEVDESDGEGGGKKKGGKSKSGGGAASKKRKRDAGDKKKGPKRAITSYMAFSAAVREQVKADNPTAAVSQIVSLIAERWRALSAEDKVQYEEIAAADKDRYEQEMAEMVKAGLIEEKQTGKGKGKGKGRGKGKQSDAFQAYYESVKEEYVKEHEEQSPEEIVQGILEQWGALPKEDQEPYKLQGIKLKKQRRKEEKAAKAARRASGGDMEDEEAAGEEGKQKKHKKKKHKDKEKKKVSVAVNSLTCPYFCFLLM